MKKLLLPSYFFLLTCFVPAYGNETDEMISKDFALVQVLDKASGKTKQLKLPAGKESVFEKLSINVKSCLAASEFQPESYSAFFQIYKSAPDGKPRVFSGWMMSNSPGANPLEDENYDLWLVKCL
ncbi:MAG: DUF2155 domain-containing protein [Rickettsiales bacterium]|jgi:hypothetical protein|nr:DUF2155 domain-containing protein [Rickettsiales bacterium]